MIYDFKVMMGNRFSFNAAEKLIQLLNAAHAVLGNRLDKLIQLYKQLGNAFRDGEYLDLMGTMNGAYNASQATKQQLGITIATIVRYKERLYQLYTEDLIAKIDFEPIAYKNTVRFKSAGERLEKKIINSLFKMRLG